MNIFQFPFFFFGPSGISVGPVFTLPFTKGEAGRGYLQREFGHDTLHINITPPPSLLLLRGGIIPAQKPEEFFLNWFYKFYALDSIEFII
jgi:hypothetical protein